MKRKSFLFFLFVIWGWSSSVSQTTATFFENLSTKDGLSHRWVFDIMQDSRGFIWISTFDGLNRFDGNTFKVYRPSESGFKYPGNRVRWAEEDPDGKFIVSTEVGILSFDPYHESFSLLQKDPTLSNIYFFATKNEPQGKWRMNGTDFHASIQLPIHFFCRNDTGFYELPIRTISRVDDLKIIFYNSAQIWFQSSKGKFLKLDTQENFLGEIDLPTVITNDIPIDTENKCWHIDPKSGQLSWFQLDPTVRLHEWSQVIYGKENIWILKKGANKSLYRFDLDTKKLETIASEVDFILNDHKGDFSSRPPLIGTDGTIWMGQFQGILKLQRNHNLFSKFLDKPFAQGSLPPMGISARSITEDNQGNIYVQEQFGTVFKINPDSGNALPLNISFSAENGSGNIPEAPNIIYLLADKEGMIWMGTTNYGLLLYNPSYGTFQSYLPPIKTSPLINLIIELDRNLMVAGDDKIWLFDKSSKQFQLLSENEISLTMGLREPESPIIWSCYEDGLVQLNTKDGSIKKIELYQHPRDHRSIILHGGFFWLGTSRGLVKIDTTSFSNITYSRAQGLPGNFVYSILPENDHLWLGTSDGLCRFDIKTTATQNYYVEDGLAHNEFNGYSAYRAKNGTFYMGGLNGLSAFHPENLQEKQFGLPKILWSDFSYLDTKKDSIIYLKISEKDTGHIIEIQPAIGNFTFYLGLNNYTDPSKNKYAWRMDGIDNNWNYAGNQSFAVYNRLPPGKYIFRAKAADPYGRWSFNELAIRLNVLRPWYDRWWAWIIYSFVLGGMIYLFYRIQLSKKLEQAEYKRLKELDDFKTRFFTNITHEFRTPLTVILGTTEQLYGKVETESKLNLIKRSGKNLLRLINQILDLVKLESGSLKMNYVHGNITSYLKYIIESFESLATAKNVSLDFDKKADSIQMDYDPEHLLQVVHNLLSNAIKFTQPGGIVTIAVGKAEEKWLQLNVKDTGPGIPSQDLPNIFDRFFQASNSNESISKGSGIGLSLTKELVKNMGGSISAESELGEGASFKVVLPITHQAPLIQNWVPGAINIPDIQSLQATSLQLPENANNEDFPTLLLIEDNPDIVEYLISGLNSDYKLEIAYNGKTGTEKALEIVPDIIISDVMMPGMDGFQVCDLLKNDIRTSHIPILLLTAKADVESRIAGLRRGADAYLAKPFNEEELQVRLTNLLETRRRLQAKYVELTSNKNLSELPDIEDEFLIKIKNIVEMHLSNSSFDVPQLSRQIGLSQSQLYRKIKALTGRSTAAFVRLIKLQKGEELLQTTNLTISEIAYEVGFSTPNYFSDAFFEEFGQRPTEIRA